MEHIYKKSGTMNTFLLAKAMAIEADLCIGANCTDWVNVTHFRPRKHNIIIEHGNAIVFSLL